MAKNEFWGEGGIEERARKYAKKVGATKRLTGEFAWSSPRYRRKTQSATRPKDRGRYVKLEGDKKGKIQLYDNKKGHIEID